MESLNTRTDISQNIVVHCESHNLAIEMLLRKSLQWRHNERVSNHQPRDCLFKCLFRHRSMKPSKLASLAFVRGIYRWPVNSPHKGPATRKMFPFDDVIMSQPNKDWRNIQLCYQHDDGLGCLDTMIIHVYIIFDMNNMIKYAGTVMNNYMSCMNTGPLLNG